MTPDHAFLAVYSIVGVVLVLWGTRHFNNGLSILDAFVGIVVGAAVGIPLAVITFFCWLASREGASWLHKKRW